LRLEAGKLREPAGKDAYATPKCVAPRSVGILACGFWRHWNKQASKASVDLAHQRGLKVWIYTVNDTGLAAQLLDAGVDGIITNEIRLIRDFMKSP